MTALVIALDLLISLICWLIAWQLIRLQPQIVMLVAVIDNTTISVERLGLVPALLADRQQQIYQFQQLYQQPLTVIDQVWQLVRLLLWVRTRR
jgi:hypothetical protein